MRKTSNYGLFAILVCALALLWVAPAAQACCTPCDPWCNVFLGPKDPCCTGIPEPGNACGLTTCAEWKEENGYDRANLTALFQAPTMSPIATSPCQAEAVAEVEEVEGTEG